MHSHHSHSGEFCKHASSTLSEVLERAYELGFTHFHLSEHVPRVRDAHLYPEEHEAGMTPASLTEQFKAYLVKARALQKVYAQKLRPMQILVGCETENIESPESLDALTALLTQTSNSSEWPLPPFVGLGTVDYIVGSVHHAHGIPIDFDMPTFKSALCARHDKYTALLLAYLDAQYEVMQRLRPEVIGHFDLYRLFDPSAPWYPDRNTSEGCKIYARLDRNIRFAASYGALFETNSAAFRKGWKGETYPGRVVLHMIQKAHGRLALSDDSHGVKQVALNYVRMREYLLNEGVHEVWYLTPAQEQVSHVYPCDMQHTFALAEDARIAREQSDKPGRDAPTTFARGARAVCVRDWHTWTFWADLPQSLLTPT